MKSNALVFAALALACCTSAWAAEVLHVVEHADTDAVTDTGAKDDSAGDILTFANPVLDKANAKKIGTNQGYCVRTVAGKSWECWWTLFLAGGQITVQGPFYDKGDSVLAITGGTGKYSAARGQMKLHARNEKGSEYDFVYELE
ncbi:MAG TPA: dirigent protein [Steroidobacteraceae bacterium]